MGELHCDERQYRDVLAGPQRRMGELHAANAKAWVNREAMNAGAWVNRDAMNAATRKSWLVRLRSRDCETERSRPVLSAAGTAKRNGGGRPQRSTKA